MQTVVGSACQKLDQTPRPGRPASAVNQQLSIISEINHLVPHTTIPRGSEIAALTSSHPPAAPRSHRVPQGPARDKAIRSHRVPQRPARDTAARSHMVPQTRRHVVTWCLRHGGTESQGASDTAAGRHRVPQRPEADTRHYRSRTTGTSAVAGHLTVTGKGGWWCH